MTSNTKTEAGASLLPTLAATVQRRIDACCVAANTPGADYFDASTSLIIATRDLLAAIAAGGAQEPVAWLVTGGKTFRDKPFITEEAADKSIAERNDGAHKLALCAAPLPREAATVLFQQRVQPWMLECFGAEIAADRIERNHRFFEEATELVQACGMTASEAHQLVDYTFGRPTGEPAQEVGGVMVTLAALCLANGLDMHEAGESELARINAPETVAKIRAKQAAKPKHSPLPQAPETVALTGDQIRSALEASGIKLQWVGRPAEQYTCGSVPVETIATALRALLAASGDQS